MTYEYKDYEDLHPDEAAEWSAQFYTFTKKIYKHLEGLGFTVTEGDPDWNSFYVNEYHVFSQTTFKVKELKGWLFGLWLNFDKEKPEAQFTMDLFARYELTFSKFKPTRSNLLVTENLDQGFLDLITDKIVSEEDPEDGAKIFESTMYYVDELLAFMKKYPELAFCQDYCYDPKYEYISRARARLIKLGAYMRYKTRDRLNNKCYKYIVKLIKKELLPLLPEGTLIEDNGDDTSPKYDILVPLKALRKYDADWTEGGCYDAADVIATSQRSDDKASYKALVKKLMDKTAKKIARYEKFFNTYLCAEFDYNYENIYRTPLRRN